MTTIKITLDEKSMDYFNLLRLLDNKGIEFTAQKVDEVIETGIVVNNSGNFTTTITDTK